MALEINLDALLDHVFSSKSIWIKKLSTNDRSWADSRENSHQNGFYVPRAVRESGFFPPLVALNRDKPHIYEVRIATEWLGSDLERKSRIVHYSNKGHEAHFTGVPPEEFAELTPASLLVCGHGSDSYPDGYWLAVIDARSDAASVLEGLFNISASFHSGIFDPQQLERTTVSLDDGLVQELKGASATGTLPDLIRSAGRLPSPNHLASLAQAEFLKRDRLTSLNAFEMLAPGDALMEISRDIEYRLYREAEIRHRAADVLRILTEVEGADLPSAIVRGYPALTASFLSASQHRKSRAGRSFENHIARMLTDSGVRFASQMVTGGRRPDFVVPNDAPLSGPGAGSTIILSAKTTLRERWKQLGLERFESQLFLATVDDRITSEAIDDMHRHGIVLVVPEALKRSKERETDYGGKVNVITFKDFFEIEVRQKRPWVLVQP